MLTDPEARAPGTAAYEPPSVRAAKAEAPSVRAAKAVPPGVRAARLVGRAAEGRSDGE